MVDKREVFLTLVQRNFYTVLKYSGARAITNIEKALELSEDEIIVLRSLAKVAQNKSEKQFNYYFVKLKRSTNHSFAFSNLESILEHRGANIQKEEYIRFREILCGKKVAIVGAADSINDKNQGAHIDSFDLVVRINFHWPVPQAQQADRGERLDILYHCCNGDFPVRSLFVQEFNQVRFVCWNRNIESLLLERYCLENNIPSLDISEISKQVEGKIGSPPNTGTAAIAHLLTTELKQLYVTGFSFQTSAYPSNAISKGAQGDVWRHQSAAQLTFFKELLLRDDRLLVDRPLCDLLSGN